MTPKNQLPYHCDNCRLWRYSRTDKTYVCVNPKSSYYGEDTEAGHCCIDHIKKEEKKS